VNGQPRRDCTGHERIGPFEFRVEGEASEVQRVAQSFIEQGFKHMATKKKARSSFFEENWQKLAAVGCGVLFASVMLIIAIAVPNPTTTQWFIFRVVLALAAAGIGAVLPGLIVVNVSKFVRAGGAIALFVLVYLSNPPQLVVQQPSGTSIQQNTHGTNSPAVVSGGDVVIGGEKQKSKARTGK
jgi:hypothetical protein